jgi:Tfp pilus assembly protein FimV
MATATYRGESDKVDWLGHIFPQEKAVKVDDALADRLKANRFFEVKGQSKDDAKLTAEEQKAIDDARAEEAKAEAEAEKQRKVEEKQAADEAAEAEERAKAEAQAQADAKAKADAEAAKAKKA